MHHLFKIPNILGNNDFNNFEDYYKQGVVLISIIHTLN